MGLIVGLFCAVILAVVAWVWQGSAILGILLGITLICNMFIAATVGTAVPLVLKRLNVDRCGVSALYPAPALMFWGL